MVRQKIGRGPRLPELHASSGGLALGTGLIDVANLRQRPPQVPARRYEQHAVLFPAREWWASTPARLLQEHPHLKTPIDPATHAALHEEVSKVPVPDSHTLERVVFLRGTIEDDIVASVRGLMRRLDESSRTAARRDRDLAELAIECLRAQVPFLEYGTPSRK